MDLDHLKSEGDLNLGPARERWQQAHLNVETNALLARDTDVFLHQSLSSPCLNAIQSARGAEITDLQDRALLDFHGNGVHHLGHGHPRVLEAVRATLERLPFCPRRYTNEPAVALAERLVSLAPDPLSRVLFAPGGTSAIGMALKLARVATGRFKTISMWDAFHGASLDAISIGGEAVFRRGIGPLLPGCEHVPPPDHTHCPFKCGHACNLDCADYIDYVLAKEGDVAAVIGETVRCTPYVPPTDYWRRVRAACDRHGALLILDEIPIGLGRTGRMFAFEHFDVVPDMVVLGKALGGGVFPLAALIAREELNVAGHTALGHYTHEKSPVACAAALAALDVIEEEQLLAAAIAKGAWLRTELGALKERHSIVGEVRGIGLLLGVELIRSDGSRAIEEAERVMYDCLARGLSFKITMGNILTLTPPLTITEAQLRRAVDILDAAIGEL